MFFGDLVRSLRKGGGEFGENPVEGDVKAEIERKDIFRKNNQSPELSIARKKNSLDEIASCGQDENGAFARLSFGSRRPVRSVFPIAPVAPIVTRMPPLASLPPSSATTTVSASRSHISPLHEPRAEPGAFA